MTRGAPIGVGKLDTDTTLPTSFGQASRHTNNQGSRSEGVSSENSKTLHLPLRPLLLISGLTALVFAHHLYLSRQSASATNVTSESNVANRGAASTIAPPVSRTPTFTQEPGSTRARLDTATRAVILGCTKRLPVLAGANSRPFGNLREYLEVATQAPGQAPTENVIEFRNLHLLDGEGHHLRLRIASTGEPGQLETKLLGVDDESLPVPLPLPEELNSLGLFEAIDRFKARGQVVLDETSEIMKWNGGIAASVFRQDGHVMSLRVSYQGGELVCRSAAGDQDYVSCRCL